MKKGFILWMATLHKCQIDVFAFCSQRWSYALPTYYDNKKCKSYANNSVMSNATEYEK